METGIVVLLVIVTLVAGLLIGYIIRKNVGEKAIGSAEQRAKNLILDAENKSETIKKEITIEAKEEAHRMRNEAEREVRERRAEIQRSEKRLIQKEEAIDRKTDNIEKKEESIVRKEQQLVEKNKELESPLSFYPLYEY